METAYLPEISLLPRIRMARLYDTEKAGIREKTGVRTVQSYEMSLFLTEGGSLFPGGDELPIHRWDLRFSRPGEQLCSRPPYRCFTVFFDFGEERRVSSALLDRIPAFFAGQEEMAPLFRDLVEAYERQEPGDLTLANGLLLQILALCGRLQSQKDRYHSATRQCIAYIRAHLDGDLRLEVLGEQTGYSGLHLLRLFRQDTGQSPHSYAQILRMTRARQLLAETGQPIPLIARSCGFSSESYFQACFKRQNGMTPGEYRRRAGLF